MPATVIEDAPTYTDDDIHEAMSTIVGSARDRFGELSLAARFLLCASMLGKSTRFGEPDEFASRGIELLEEGIEFSQGILSDLLLPGTITETE